LAVSRLTVSELLLEKRGLSADIALRIGKLLNTTPESWLRMQAEHRYHRAPRDDRAADMTSAATAARSTTAVYVGVNCAGQSHE
jgi:plasmid maintenance system antidote protein VapI